MSQALADAPSWRKLKCQPLSRTVCEGTDCKSAEPAIALLLDKPAGVVSRCDDKGCDNYRAQFNSGGAFTNIQSDIPNGYMVKVFGKEQYLEIATTLLVSHISTGSCSENN
jgi:hypothetical protein